MKKKIELEKMIVIQTNAIDNLKQRNNNLDQRCMELTKQKDGAYKERDKLVVVLSKIYPSHLCRHPDSDLNWENDWRWIVCIHTPNGQCTWHIHDSEREWFNHLKVLDNHWDGHSTEEKYVRLKQL